MNVESDIVLADDGMNGRAGLALAAEERHEHSGTMRRVVASNGGNHARALGEIVVLRWLPPPQERDLANGAIWLHGRQMNAGVFTHRFGQPPEHGGFAGRHQRDTAEGVQYIATGGVAVLKLGGRCRLWGFITTARQFGEVRVTVDREERRLLRVECVCLLDGWTLAPGEQLASEWLFVLEGDNPAALLETYASALAHEMRARPASRPPTGWCSWYSLYNQTSEEVVLANVEALRRERVPVEIVQIDDGYQSSTGDWLTPNARFPSGMADLARRIHEAGFVPGLWLAPFVLHRESATLHAHPEWVVRNRDGSPRFLRSWLGEVAALDCTHPEVRAWLRYVTETVTRDWGYRYLKLDALAYAAQPDALYHAPNTTAAANLRAGLEEIRAAAGDEIVILGCTCDFGPAVGLVDAMRVGADVETRWYDPRHLPSAFNALRLTLPRWFMHGRWWINDPDCLLVRDTSGTLTLEEVRTLATGIAISGGSVFLGDDVRDLSPARLAIAMALLPPSGEALRPLDLLDRETPRLFARPTPDGGAIVAVFNWSDEAIDIDAPCTLLSLPPGRYHIFEFWERLYLGTPADGLPPERIEPHSCRLYRLRPDRGVPAIVGTGGHVSMGLAAVARESWDAEAQALTIALDRAWTRPERLYLAVPPALREATLYVAGATGLEREGALLRLDCAPAQARTIRVEFRP